MHNTPLIGTALLALALAAPGAALAQGKFACSADALVHAEALLAFHLGNNEGKLEPNTMRRMNDRPNPAGGKQMLHVLEVTGSLYKTNYRMRMVYHRLGDGSCLLMGQEVQEMSRP